MFAFTPASEAARRSRCETLRLWQAAESREEQAAAASAHRAQQAVRAATAEKQATKRTVKLQARRVEKTRSLNIGWQMKALTALDVRQSLDDAFRRTSEIQLAVTNRRSDQLSLRREQLEAVVTAETQIRSRLLRSASHNSHFNCCVG